MGVWERMASKLSDLIGGIFGIGLKQQERQAKLLKEREARAMGKKKKKKKKVKKKQSAK